jgi:hypothetical protein
MAARQSSPLMTQLLWQQRQLWPLLWQLIMKVWFSLCGSQSCCCSMELSSACCVPLTAMQPLWSWGCFLFHELYPGKLGKLIFQYIYTTRCNVTQSILSRNCSACSGWYFHLSSGAHTTVSTASGICHTVTATCRYQLEPVWVCCGWRMPPTAHWNQFQLFHDSGR